MAHYTRFEDLPIWQKAREICTDVYALTSKGAFARDFELKDQIKRSSGSCMDNIAEGFERDGNKEFKQCLSISKGSIGETRSQLYRALDRGHITLEEFEALRAKCLDEGKDIGNLMRYLRDSERKGSKFESAPSQISN
jgi:four helix bundle protein